MDTKDSDRLVFPAVTPFRFAIIIVLGLSLISFHIVNCFANVFYSALLPISSIQSI